jgi:hypothetical protein
MTPKNAVTTNKIRIVVYENGSATSESSCIVEIKKDGTAADERFEIMFEINWVVLSEFGKELSLTACPFQEWSNDVAGSN